MASSDFAVDLIFEGFQKATRGSGKAFGWSERYYYTTLSLDHALTAANSDTGGGGVNPAASNLCTLRRNFLTEEWRISYIRATDLRNPRATKVASPNGLTGLVGTSVKNAAQIQCAVAATLYKLPSGLDTHAHRRNIALRGLPSTLIDGNVLLPETRPFAAVVAFLDLIGFRDGNLPAQVPALVPTGRWLMAWQDITLLPKDITALNVLAPDGRFINITAPGLGDVVPGDRIIIQGVQNARGANRTWRVIKPAVDGSAILLGRSKYGLDIGNAGNIGAAKARKKRLIVGNADQYVIRGLTTRKTGRPINPLRGRASARQP